MAPDHCPPVQSVRVVEASPLQRAERPGLPGYASSLATTSLGWPSLPHWCVWVQPSSSAVPDRWEQRWSTAVQAALDQWSGVVPLQRVDTADRAHVLLQRRKPPLKSVGGRWRASNGRSLLQLLQVRRQQIWRFEPQVTVLVSPHLRAAVLQSTALHELGHAFGLWGHSDQAGDAMAVSQGRSPLLRLSERDQLTLEWMRRQPTQFGKPMEAD